MANLLGTSRKPAIVRVASEEAAERILAICREYDWEVIVGVEPDAPEDVRDVERLLRSADRARRLAGQAPLFA